MILAAALLFAAVGEFEIEPRPLAWTELSPAKFDQRWVLPETRAAGGPDLLAKMRLLSESRFEVRDAEGREYRCLGDLARTARNLSDEQLGTWMDGLTSDRRGSFAAWREPIEKLLSDGRLATSRWTPARESKDDGLLMAPTWDLGAEEAGPWRDLAVRPELEQAATLIRADLATLKAVESDYRAYPSNVGADYETIMPVPGSYFVGEDPEQRPFSTLRIRFECDLQFPFSSYTTRLCILNHFDADGTLHTDIYSTSQDFYWLAGRDVFLPVTDSDGEWYGWLLVRDFGFDLDGVPDGSRHRREALRGTLGNLKRNAERAFARHLARGGEPVNEDFLHAVPVRGAR